MSDVAFARPSVPPQRVAPAAIGIGGVLGAVLFVLGIGLGVLLQTVVNPATPENPYLQLPPVPEPATAAELVQLIVANDSVGLARALDMTILERLRTGIDPLVDVDKMEFTGAVERQGDILSSYVASGRTPSGDKFIVGIALRVRESRVVGVN